MKTLTFLLCIFASAVPGFGSLKQPPDRLSNNSSLWKSNPAASVPPEEPLTIRFPLAIKSASASSGDGSAAIDGANQTVWKSTTGFPQVFTLDLGTERDPVNCFSYLPPQDKNASAGCITRFRISTSIDGRKFETSVDGMWNADRALKVVEFPSVAARFVKIEILQAVGNFAAASEFGVGSH